MDNYSALSSKGQQIPIHLYDRGNNELVLVFDKKLNMGIYSVLVIIPHQKMIGIPEGGINSYINLAGSLYQKNEAIKISSIYPATSYFENPEIFDVQFLNDRKILFKSSIKGLSEFGDSFLLKYL